MLLCIPDTGIIKNTSRITLLRSKEQSLHTRIYYHPLPLLSWNCRTPPFPASFNDCTSSFHSHYIKNASPTGTVSSELHVKSLAFITRGTLSQAFKLPTDCRSFYSKNRLSLENCARLGHYSANRGNFLATFRETTYRFHLQGFLGSF